MSVLVVDASVVIKWFVPETHSEAARRLLRLSHQYFAPDLIFAETANVVWKKVRRGDIPAESAPALVHDLGRIAVETVPSRSLAGDAYRIAAAINQTVYDALYLALAVRLDTKLITADVSFYHSVRRLTPLAKHIEWIGTFA